MTKHIENMTKAEMLACPRLSWDDSVDDCDWVVIIPHTRKDGLHDSGYRRMSYLFGRRDGWMRLGGGGSDVLHIGGISEWMTAPPVGWSIDCLAKSGLLRLFAPGQDSLCSDMTSLSSVEIKTHKQKRSRP